MAAGFKPGDKAYIVENNRIVRQCTVVRVSAGMHLIRFENGGGIQVKAHRLFIVKYKCRKLQTKNVGRCNYIL